MQRSELSLQIIFLTSALISVVLVLLVAMFLIYYQKRSLRHQADLKDLEHQHQIRLMNASIETQERERSRIARDLHDGLGALLMGVNLQVRQLGRILGPDQLTEKGKKCLDLAKDLLSESIINVRRVSHELASAKLQDEGLFSALESMVDQLNVIESIHIDLWIPNREDETDILEYSVQLGLYRIVQELINNTFKHAMADKISITIDMNAEALLLRYTDNGVGFDTKTTNQGLGLKNMENRARLFNGNFEISGKLNKGCEARVTIPIQQQNEAS